MYTPEGRSLHRFRLIILIVLGTFWMYRAHLDMLNGVVSHSRFGKRPAAWVMAIFGSHVGPRISNIGFFEYMKVYDCIWSCLKVYESILTYIKLYEGI